MILLALQFAVQPILTKKFAPKGTLIRSTYVLAQDLTRIGMTALLLTLTGSWTVAVQHWTWKTALWTAGVPSVLYMLQNYCSLMAYQNLAPLAYNVLNQTKTLSAALFCFLLMGQRQSGPQMVALGILLLSALVMENVVQLPSSLTKQAQQQPGNESDADNNDDSSTKDDKPYDTSSTAAAASTNSQQRRMHILDGVVPVLAASLISGLAGAWIQRALQTGRGSSNSLFLTLQLSALSACFWIASLQMPFSPDRQRASEVGSWTTGWTAYTWLPILSNSAGGLLVGLVTKFSGVVPKGFALIAGMFLSGILQNAVAGESRVAAHQWVGGILAAVSVYLHAAFPAVAPK